MKIGIDASILARKNITGINRLLRNILYYLAKLDKNNEYFLFSPVELIEFDQENYNLIITNRKDILFNNKYLVPFWLHFLLPRALNQVGVDIFFQPNYFVPLFSTTKNIQYVTLIPDLITKKMPYFRNSMYKLYLNMGLLNTLKKSEKIVTISNNSKKDILHYYKSPQEKIDVIYLAANKIFKPRILDEKSKKIIIDKYKIPENYILHIGAIEKRKNIIGILNICDIVRSKNLNINLVLIGKGGYGYKEIISEINKRKYIRYLGYVENKDLPYILNLAKIFLFPTFYEGFGLPPLEAMRSGLPTLTSNTSSMPEIVGEGGIMHNPKDYEGFAKDIIRLLEDNFFYQVMKEKALKQAKKFEWEISCKKLIEIFNKL
jgi:glycosyltransferase involved in cell wall biosynthesis